MSTRRGSQGAPTCLGAARHHGRLLATQHIKRRSWPQTPLRQRSRRVTARPQASIRDSRPHPSGGVERFAGLGSQPGQNRPLYVRRKCNSSMQPSRMLWPGCDGFRRRQASSRTDVSSFTDSRLVVIGQVHIVCIPTLETKGDPPIRRDTHGPVAIEVSLQQMQAVTGLVRVLSRHRGIQVVQDLLDSRHMVFG